MDPRQGFGPAKLTQTSATSIVGHTPMDDYKRASGRMFPTWCEVLEVLTGLGYRKRL
jgi:hypothetical protein